jgi:uncharacterized protein YndB with AHSA1/START domain
LCRRCWTGSDATRKGNDLPNRGVYLEVVENERLVITDAYTMAWEPAEKPFMAVILTFEDEGGQDAVHCPRASLDGRRPRGAREDGLPQGWGQCADQLATLVAKL